MSLRSYVLAVASLLSYKPSPLVFAQIVWFKSEEGKKSLLLLVKKTTKKTQNLQAYKFHLSALCILYADWRSCSTQIVINLHPTIINKIAYLPMNETDCHFWCHYLLLW